MATVHVVLPNDVDDPAEPSGGNIYDRRICRGLTDSGWVVREHAVRGGWPRPSVAERDRLTAVLASIPDAAAVLVDGLIASVVPDVLGPQAGRLRLTVLVHMPLGTTVEGRALATASAVITTSHWARQRLIEAHGLPPDRLQVAEPGVDPAPLAPGSDAGGRLVCVAAVTPMKGHDLLVDALAKVADLPWTCLCVGSLTREPGFVEGLYEQIREHGLTERIRLAGPLPTARVDAVYASADLVVLASRSEAYGMVVTEGLARGIPALATSVGGLPEALGRAPEGDQPGLLVPPGDAAALADGVRRWLDDADLRQRSRRAARERRYSLTGWEVTSERVGRVVAEASANGGAA
jgi:glycosyltransferase involved in cell wall biosynthesis